MTTLIQLGSILPEYLMKNNSELSAKTFSASTDKIIELLKIQKLDKY